MRIWIAAAVIVAAGGLGLWLWPSSSAESTAPARELTAAASSSQSAHAASVARTPAPTLERVATDRTGAVVKADQVVATINGTAIAGRQLVPFGSESQQTMTKEMFDYLRRRAIDRELTFQAAKRAGIELSTAQLAELDQVRRNAIEHGVTDATEIDLQVADARAGLLQPMLLGSAIAAASDAEVDREIGELPTDAVALQQVRLETRQKLADRAQADYTTKLRAYLDDLARDATITN